MRSKSNVLLYNITAVVIGLVISGLLLLFMKVNPLDVCGQALGKIVTDQYNLGEILVKATPLIFTSLAFAFTYNANLFNIGAQGQFTMGALQAVSLAGSSAHLAAAPAGAAGLLCRRCGRRRPHRRSQGKIPCQ